MCYYTDKHKKGELTQYGNWFPIGGSIPFSLDAGDTLPPFADYRIPFPL